MPRARRRKVPKISRRHSRADERDRAAVERGFRGIPANPYPRPRSTISWTETKLVAAAAKMKAKRRVRHAR